MDRPQSLHQYLKNTIETLQHQCDILKLNRKDEHPDSLAISHCLELLQKVHKGLESTSHSACDPVPCCPFQEIIDPVEPPPDKDQYLCVSDGFTMWCFDLKDTEEEPNDYCFAVEEVPSTISTLKLLEAEGCPVSLGLFKAGSCAYMVVGQGFPGFKDPNLTYLKDVSSELKGFSVSHLSLEKGKLCLSQCGNIKLLNKPEPKKLWPTVEKINNHIHVIESVPSTNHCFEIRSHETLNLDYHGRGWIELSPVRFPWRKARNVDLSNHIVVGDRMYAGVARHRGISCEFVVFDSKTRKWDAHRYPSDDRSCLLSVKHVAEILKYGFGRCVGEYLHGGSSLYVVLAIGCEYGPHMVAVAYLVTEKGQVLCFQRLNRFFEGFKRPFAGTKGTVVSCGGGQGKTMCTIHQGCYEGPLFITAFTWEGVDEALELISELRSQIRDDEDLKIEEFPFTDEENFINVVVKGWYVKNLETDLLWLRPDRFSACFL